MGNLFRSVHARTNKRGIGYHKFDCVCFVRNEIKNRIRSSERATTTLKIKDNNIAGVVVDVVVAAVVAVVELLLLLLLLW